MPGHCSNLPSTAQKCFHHTCPGTSSPSSLFLESSSPGAAPSVSANFSPNPRSPPRTASLSTPPPSPSNGSLHSSSPGGASPADSPPPISPSVPSPPKP